MGQALPTHLKDSFKIPASVQLWMYEGPFLLQTQTPKRLFPISYFLLKQSSRERIRVTSSVIREPR